MTGPSATFTHHGAVEVVRVSPASGPVGGGTSVVVEGSGFMFTRWLACRFGLVTVSALYENSTHIVCTSPSTEAGPSTVRVTLNGVDYSTSGSTFEHVAAARVLGLSPRSGSIGGGTTVSVSGSGSVSVSGLGQAVNSSRASRSRQRIGGCYVAPRRSPTLRGMTRLADAVVLLTGAAGGHYTATAAGEREVIELDAVDFCRTLGGRREGTAPPAASYQRQREARRVV